MAENVSPGYLRAVFETFKDHAWHTRWAGYLVVAAFLFQIIASYVGAPETWDYWIDRFTIVAVLVVLLVGGTIREWIVRRGHRFASAQKNIHRIHHLIRDLNTYLDQSLERFDRPEDIDYKALKDCERLSKASIAVILDKLVGTFNLITGTSCRAAIKGIVEHEGRYFVYTLTRDSDSQHAYFELDRKRQQEFSDPLEENFDFLLIFDKNNVDRWFFDNFLPTNDDYKNSQDRELATRRDGKSTLVKNLFPRMGWHLPYVATIVWPIQQKEGDGLDFEPPGCFGFLAVDANRKNAFEARFDTFLGAGIADALFHPILKLTQLTSKLDQPRAEGDDDDHDYERSGEGSAG